MLNGEQRPTDRGTTARRRRFVVRDCGTAVGEDITLDGAGMERGIQTNARGSQHALSTRAKNSGHGKKTADKWNQ
jgi:hypothetical protein